MHEQKMSAVRNKILLNSSSGVGLHANPVRLHNSFMLFIPLTRSDMKFIKLLPLHMRDHFKKAYACLLIIFPHSFLLEEDYKARYKDFKKKTVYKIYSVYRCHLGFSPSILLKRA